MNHAALVRAIEDLSFRGLVRLGIHAYAPWNLRHFAIQYRDGYVHCSCGRRFR